MCKLIWQSDSAPMCLCLFAVGSKVRGSRLIRLYLNAAALIPRDSRGREIQREAGVRPACLEDSRWPRRPIWNSIGCKTRRRWSVFIQVARRQPTWFCRDAYMQMPQLPRRGVRHQHTQYMHSINYPRSLCRLIQIQIWITAFAFACTIYWNACLIQKKWCAVI